MASTFVFVFNPHLQSPCSLPFTVTARLSPALVVILDSEGTPGVAGWAAVYLPACLPACLLYRFGRVWLDRLVESVAEENQCGG